MSRYIHAIEVIIEADSAGDSLCKTEDIVGAIWSAGLLPQGATIFSYSTGKEVEE